MPKLETNVLPRSSRSPTSSSWKPRVQQPVSYTASSRGAAGLVTSHRPSPRLPAADGSVRKTSQTCSPTAAMSWPASGPYLAVYTTTSSCEAPGTSRLATTAGCAGSRASMTATPPLGQNCGCEESKKPQRPMYANRLYAKTSPLKPRAPRSFWPTAIMFSADPLLVPPWYVLPDESRKCCSLGSSSSFGAAVEDGATASTRTARLSAINTLRMSLPSLGGWRCYVHMCIGGDATASSRLNSKRPTSLLFRGPRSPGLRWASSGRAHRDRSTSGGARERRLSLLWELGLLGAGDDV